MEMPGPLYYSERQLWQRCPPARGALARLARFRAENNRLLKIMAAALERTQVDDSGEATFILEREVNLDGTKKVQDA